MKLTIELDLADVQTAMRRLLRESCIDLDWGEGDDPVPSTVRGCDFDEVSNRLTDHLNYVLQQRYS